VTGLPLNEDKATGPWPPRPVLSSRHRPAQASTSDRRYSCHRPGRSSAVAAVGDAVCRDLDDVSADPRT